mmetsp:Transcript_18142/g.50428  ORF Transcript_18142/g.50428 Transcript_18142/m.50428 type:complete len:202 (-) Transcript_18142:881-1486(-)
MPCCPCARTPLLPGAGRDVAWPPSIPRDLDLQKVLRERDRPQQPIDGKRQEEEVGHLPIKADGAQAESEGLVDVRLLGVEGLLRDEVREAVHPTPVRCDLYRRLGEELPAAQARVERRPDLLQVPNQEDANHLQRAVDDRLNPMSQIMAQAPSQRWGCQPDDRKLHHLGDRHRVGSGLRELQLQRRQHRQASGPQGADSEL